MRVRARNQKGMISITVTVILMLVVTITVLSFATVIRHQQRQALDNQLSSQAFYAAESGVNDAKKAVATYMAAHPGLTPPNKTCAADDTNYPSLTSGIVDATNHVSYSCVMITSAPDSLKYDLSPSGGDKVFPLQVQNGSLTSLTLSWTADSSATAPVSSCSGSSATLPTAGAWSCPFGIIRIDLVPIVSGQLTRTNLMKNQFTAFIAPTTSGSPSVSYTAAQNNLYGGAANQGVRPNATCGSTCTIKITGLDAIPSGEYYARVGVLYRPTTLTISAASSVDTTASLINAQLMVDSTGKAQDVLRRIQVRVPQVQNTIHSDYAIQSTDDLCKNFHTGTLDSTGDSNEECSTH